MKSKKINLNDQQEHELSARLIDIDRELFALRNELAMNKKLDKPHLIRARRKEKAQILTNLTQKLIAKGVA
jgi:large subunit ribosomal protein L29